MSQIINKAKVKILAGLVSMGLLVGGIILLNQGATPSMTVQEWQILVEIYNEETQGGIILENVKNKADILDKLDVIILTKAQDREIDEKNMIEGLLIKRSSKNKDVIENLRKAKELVQ